jgi:ribosomal protein S18 acetylase RimI-like enzyme
MITIKRIKTTDTKLYNFMEQLIEKAFSQAERRPSDDLRQYAEKYENFCVCVIIDDNQPVGLFNYWIFDHFYFVEHFAISDNIRKQGYGSMTLGIATKTFTKPIVLEVSPPETDAIAQRRINFYQRCGFTIWDIDYTHPPYPGNIGDSHLRLMIHGDLDCQKDYESIRDTIWTNVYHSS